MPMPRSIRFYGMAALAIAVLTEPAVSQDFRGEPGAGNALQAHHDEPDADDARTRLIVDAQLPPFSAVGRFVGVVVCTGSLVLDPRIVVTAAHCVVEHDGTLTHSPLTFQPGFQVGNEQESHTGEVWAVGSARQYTRQTMHDASNDWAVVVLDEAPENVQPLGLGDYGRDSDTRLTNSILLPAYGDDVSHAKVLTVDRACSIRNIIWEVLLHDCTVSHGASGAPLLVRVDDWFVVIGINSATIAFPAFNHRPLKIMNSAVGSRFFSAAVRGVYERLRGGLGPGCRFQWSAAQTAYGLRTC